MPKSGIGMCGLMSLLASRVVKFGCGSADDVQLGNAVPISDIPTMVYSFISAPVLRWYAARVGPFVLMNGCPSELSGA